MKLYPFQETGRNALRQHDRFILGDEMGLGKTAQALAALEARHLPVLVICPASVRLVWADEVAKWCPRLSVEVIESGRQQLRRADVTVISYHLFGRMKLHKPATMICDEAHYLQSKDAARTQFVVSAAGPAGKPGALRVWLLSGTPLWSRPRSLYPLAVLTGIWKAGYWEFAGRYCGASAANQWDDTGATNLKELQDRLAPVLLRRLKDEVLPQLPAKTRQVVKVAAGLSDAEQEIRNFDPAAVRSGWIPPGPIATAIRETAAARLPEMVRHLRVLLATEDKLVVFAWNLEIMDGLEAGLREFGVVRIDGSTKAADRQQAVDQFQRGAPRVFIGQTVAAGTGLTLTAARVAVFAQPDWTPANLMQAEDRIHRIGQRDSVLVQYLVTRGSIEERMLASVMAKLRTAKTVLGDDERKDV